MKIKDKTIRFPIKIGDRDRVEPYAATLTHGEEQLIVTRDCCLYLTNGNGGYSVFKTNNGVTEDVLQDTVNRINLAITEAIEKVNEDINSNTELIDTTNDTLINLISTLGLEFEKYLSKDDFESFSTALNDTISSINNRIDNIKADIPDDIEEQLNQLRADVDDINKTIQNLNKKIESLEQSEIHASNVKVDVEENGAIIKKSLQEVITDLLRGAIIPTDPVNAAYCGNVYCGTAECGNI